MDQRRYAPTPGQVWGRFPRTLEERLARLERLIISAGASAVGYRGLDRIREIPLASRQDDEIVYALWAYTEGDGFGGWFWYKPESTQADDNIDYLLPDDLSVSQSGRWHRLT